MKKIRRITDPGKVMQSVFADRAGTIRVAEAGLDLKPIGALNTAVRVGPGAVVYVYNAVGAVGYVTFGDQSVAAPANPSTGIPVPGNSYMVLNSGDSEWVRSSAGTLFGYLADS